VEPAIVQFRYQQEVKEMEVREMGLGVCLRNCRSSISSFNCHPRHLAAPSSQKHRRSTISLLSPSLSRSSPPSSSSPCTHQVHQALACVPLSRLSLLWNLQATHLTNYSGRRCRGIALATVLQSPESRASTGCLHRDGALKHALEKVRTLCCLCA
jgi:hypothetical protein